MKIQAYGSKALHDKYIRGIPTKLIEIRFLPHTTYIEIK